MDPIPLIRQNNMIIPSSDFKTETLIGQGRLADVYTGTLRGQPVVIKKFVMRNLPNFLEREFDIYCLDRHPNIVQIFGICAERDQFCCVFESGLRSLASLIAKGDKLAFLIILQIGIDIAAALEYLHSQKIPHKYLKSSNVLLTESNR